MASQYFDGRNYGETLISIRDFLYTAQLAKNESVVDPEDALPVLFDLLGSLVEMEKEGQDSEAMQQTLINDFLIPFMEKLVGVVETNPAADFYCGCVGFIAGYLDLEKGLSG